MSRRGGTGPPFFKILKDFLQGFAMPLDQKEVD
jgi:hypothetical protein